MRRIHTIAAAVLLAGTTLPAFAQAQDRTRSGSEMVFVREAMEPRVMLGISMSADTDSEGIRVVGVTEGSPAEEAGLQAGDLITGLAGQDLTQPLEGTEDKVEPVEELHEEGLHNVRVIMAGSPAQRRLRSILSDLEADEPVDITWTRDGQSSTGTIVPRVMEPSALAMSWEGEPGSARWRVIEDAEGKDGVSVFRFDGSGNEWAPRVQVAPGHEGEMHVRVSPRIETRGGDIIRLREQLYGAQDRVRELSFGLDGGPCAVGFGIAISDRLGCVDGIQMIRMNPGLGEYFGTSEGVLITEADEENSLGLQSGDVLLAVGDRAVKDPGHAARIISSYEDDEEITLRVRRQNRETDVTGGRKN